MRLLRAISDGIRRFESPVHRETHVMRLYKKLLLLVEV